MYFVFGKKGAIDKKEFSLIWQPIKELNFRMGKIFPIL
jgi:hypothetical protein